MTREAKICAIAVLAIVVSVASAARAGTILVASDGTTDSVNIATVLAGDGHSVTTVTDDYNTADGTNTVLSGSLAAYDAVYWSATVPVFGGTHAASTMASLSSYVATGGALFVTGFDSTAGPDDPELRSLLGASGGFDGGGGSDVQAVIDAENSLTVGQVDIRGLVPTGGFADMDSLTGLAADTVGVVATTKDSGGWLWTLRSLGSGEIAYVSNGEPVYQPGYDGEHESWLDTSTTGAGAYNAAVRNFAFNKTEEWVSIPNLAPVPAAAWPGLVGMAGMFGLKLRRMASRA